jgi:hypothetical protein
MASGHCESHLKAKHGCTDQCCKREESSCQLGADQRGYVAMSAIRSLLEGKLEL